MFSDEDRAADVLLVDDADRLSSSAAAALAKLIEQRAGAVVLTVSSLAAMPAELEHCVEASQIHELRQLTSVETAEFLTAMVGPVDGRLVSDMIHYATGRPGIIEAMIADLRSAGRLRASAGRVSLGPGPAFGPRTQAQVDALLRDISAAERTAMRALCVIGACDESIAIRLTDADVCAGLIQRGLLHRVHDPGDGRRVLIPGIPIIAIVVTMDASATEIEDIYNRLLDSTHGQPEAGGIGTARALLAYRNQRVFPIAVILRAAQGCLRMNETSNAVNLVQLALRHPDIDPESHIEALTTRARAWHFQGRPDDALADYTVALRMLEPTLTTSEQNIRTWTEVAVNRGEAAQFFDGDSATADAMLAESRSVAERKAAEASAESLRSELDNAANTLEANRLIQLAWAGQHRRFRRESERFVAWDPTAKQRLRAVELVSEGIRGRPRSAYEQAGRLMRLTAQGPATWVDEEITAAMLLVSVQHNGPTAVLEALAGSGELVYLNPFTPYEGAMAQLLLSNVAFLSGDPVTALSTADTALAFMEASGLDTGKRLSLFAKAQALAMLGSHAQAKQELSTAQAMREVATMNRGAELRAEFVVRACTERSSTSRGLMLSDLRDAARLLASDEEFGTGLELLHWGVRLGDEQSARQLLTLRDHIDSTMWELAIAHAEVLLSPDPARCQILAEQARQLGLHDLVVELYSLGARQASATGGMQAVADHCRRQFAMARAMLPSLSSPTFETMPAVSLTPRERQVAQRAAAGASARQISLELHLSIRTIEGHLARIYTKLGITGRADLQVISFTQ